MAKKRTELEKKKIQRKWIVAIPFLTVDVYLILAYLLKEVGHVENAYGISSLVFLIIPLEGYIVGLKKFKFSFPILITFIYVVTCLVVEATTDPSIKLWHPLWALFLLIPPYYIFFGENRVKEQAEEFVDDIKTKYRNGIDDDVIDKED